MVLFAGNFKKNKNKKEQGSFEAFFVVPGDFRYIWKKLIQT